jgi:hypothetical protein
MEGNIWCSDEVASLRSEGLFFFLGFLRVIDSTC